MLAQNPKVSIVVPLYNEEESVTELVQSIDQVMSQSGLTYEVILIDDGSVDQTVSILTELQKKHQFVRIVQFRRNFGQTAAMAAGFDHSTGEVIVPLDGDLQNDPADIPKMVAKLDEGYDVVSGWRKNRKDTLITRKIPSWIANALIGYFTGVKLHDYGCTLKAYRREVVDHMRLYGEMHRFIPALASWTGAKVTEMVVNHRPRIYGTTKYGLMRTFKVVLDLLTVKFLGSFSTKPLHIFGGIGIVTAFVSLLSGLAVLYKKYLSDPSLPMNRNPLLTLTAMLMLMSVQFLLMGLMAEMMARTYHESQDKPTYVVRKVFEPTQADPKA